MASIFSTVKMELSKSIEDAAISLGYPVEEARSSIELSKAFGDMSSSVALKLAKHAGLNPKEASSKLSEAIKRPSYVINITTENNFINFHFDKAKISSLILERVSAKSGSYHRPLTVDASKAIIEYSSVNPNKPWHVGHLRNALLGDSISKIYEANGYKVEREDYIDDLGLQMAEIMWWREKNPMLHATKKFDHFIGEEYVKANAYLEEHKEAKPEVAEMLNLMEEGTYESEMLRDVVTKCVSAQYETAFAFNIFHDVLVWESDILREGLLKKSLELLMNNGFARKETEGEYGGCIVIDLEGIENLPEEMKGLSEKIKVLVRSDGTPTYLGKDIAFHMWKLGILEDTFKYSIFMERQPDGKPLYTTGKDGKRMNYGKADVVVNIIDSRQSHPQAVLKLAFAAIKRPDLADEHKAHSIWRGGAPVGLYIRKEGNWMAGFTADEILEEAITRASELITSRFEFASDEKERIAREVAIAAIKFEFLKYGIEKKIVFSWDRALNFEGGSGPYHQYMHARANRILEEAGQAESYDIGDVSEPEFTLLKLIASSPDMVEKACAEGRPNVIADYLNDLSSSFSKFYDKCPILKAEAGRKGT